MVDILFFFSLPLSSKHHSRLKAAIVRYTQGFAESILRTGQGLSIICPPRSVPDESGDNSPSDGPEIHPLCVMS